jgi:hypothetical protein
MAEELLVVESLDAEGIKAVIASRPEDFERSGRDFSDSQSVRRLNA